MFYMPGTVLGLGNATLRKQTKTSAFVEFTLLWEESESKQNKYVGDTLLLGEKKSQKTV